MTNVVGARLYRENRNDGMERAAIPPLDNCKATGFS